MTPSLNFGVLFVLAVAATFIQTARCGHPCSCRPCNRYGSLLDRCRCCRYHRVGGKRSEGSPLELLPADGRSGGEDGDDITELSPEVKVKDLPVRTTRADDEERNKKYMRQQQQQQQQLLLQQQPQQQPQRQNDQNHQSVVGVHSSALDRYLLQEFENSDDENSAGLADLPEQQARHDGDYRYPARYAQNMAKVDQIDHDSHSFYKYKFLSPLYEKIGESPLMLQDSKPHHNYKNIIDIDKLNQIDQLIKVDKQLLAILLPKVLKN